MPDTTYVLTEQNNIISKIDSEFLSTMLPDVVHYTEDIGKTDAEKLQARTNIDSEAKILVVTITGSNNVYFADKSYTEVDKAYKAGKIILFIFGDSTAIVTSYENEGGVGVYKAATVVKSNGNYKYCDIYYVQGLGISISFSNLSGSSNDTNAVHYTADSGKSTAEKLQARTNIGAGTADLFVITLTESGGVYSADKTFAEILAAIDAGKICELYQGDYVAMVMEHDSSTTVRFVSVVPYSNEIRFYELNGDGPDDEWVVEFYYYEEKSNKVTDLSSTSITIASAADNTIYSYGELTALTVTAIPATGDFIIRFTSGATPTTTNFPASMVFPEAFSAEANTRYEINVSDGYALVAGWPTT